MAHVIMCNKKYKDPHCIRKVINYILAPESCPHGITGALWADCSSPSESIFQFKKVKKLYRKTGGKQLIHFVVAFSPHEKFTLQEYQEIGYKIAESLPHGYQIIFGLHEKNKKNPPHNHLHFVINTVNFINGKKIFWSKSIFYDLKKLVNTLSEHP